MILAFDTIKDPRDLAEILHLAAGFGAEVHLIGKSLAVDHWKVLRKLRSWRPGLAGRPDEIKAARFEDLSSWAKEARRRGFTIAAMVVEGGVPPWSASTRGPLAILFGEETRGLSSEALQYSDLLWTIPLGPGGRFYTLGQATALVLGALSEE